LAAQSRCQALSLYPPDPGWEKWLWMDFARMRVALLVHLVVILFLGAPWVVFFASELVEFLSDEDFNCGLCVLIESIMGF